MTTDLGIMTDLLGTLSTTISAGYGRIASDVHYLFGILITLEVILFSLVWVAEREIPIKAALWKIMTISFFIFLIGNYPTLTNAVINGFIYFGLKASGGALTMKDFLNPSLIAGYGIEVTTPMLTKVSLLEPMKMAICGLCALIILFAYFIIAIQIFITFLEFYIVSLLALVLLPFSVLKPTSFLGEKALGSVISHGVKLMVLAFVVGIISPVLSAVTPPDADLKYENIFAIVFVSIGFLMLVWQVPSMAAGLMSGAPSLNAGTAIGAGVGGAALLGTAGLLTAYGAGATAKNAIAATRAAGTLTGGATTAYGMGAATTIGGSAAQVMGGARGVIAAGLNNAASKLGTQIPSKIADTFNSSKARGEAIGYASTGGTGIAIPEKAQSSEKQSMHPMRAQLLARRIVPSAAAPQGGISAPLRHN